ncbi:MAG: hypothetical protein K5675_08000 [Lachnospiraceae bacterium]|nr:hypothetical protein [Lachnospiraceae bacterium]
MKEQGSYTVEATAIFGITIGIIFAMILLGFSVYEEIIEKISLYEASENNPADIFRLIDLGKDVWEAVKK